MAMSIPHWKRRQARPADHDDAPDHLEDLRARLPAEFHDAPDAEVAQLWLAWDAARHGHGVDHLIGTCAVAADIAERLVTLAGRGQDRRDDAHPADTDSECREAGRHG